MAVESRSICKTDISRGRTGLSHVLATGCDAAQGAQDHHGHLKPGL
ncbi:hypothetical protein ASAP_0699 [Asaia bogorensis]|uniref:Uncharacterized protein n=1 Tax=Asaia bogorensis TaxID=91915 RepID=A0A060QCA4_9PROT|nr:hypothetical protein ASAP_0699 [Asaia bogorensis]